MELLGAFRRRCSSPVDKVEVLDAGTAAVGRIDLTFKSKKDGRETGDVGRPGLPVTDGKITHATSTTRTQRGHSSRAGEPRGRPDIDAARAAWELMRRSTPVT